MGNCRAGDLTWVNLQAHGPRRAQFSFKLLHLCSPKGFGNRALGLESLVQEPLRVAAMQSTGKRVGKQALSCWICCTKINGQYVPVYRQPAHRQQCSEDHNGNHRASLGYGALTLGDSLDFFKTDLILKIHQQQASFDILFSCLLHTCPAVPPSAGPPVSSNIPHLQLNAAGKTGGTFHQNIFCILHRWMHIPITTKGFAYVIICVPPQLEN